MAPRFSFTSHVRESLSHIFQRPKPTPTLGDGLPANDPFAGNFNFTQPFQITINGVNFPCTGWGTIEVPRTLERSYDMGYIGGMGVFAEDAARAPDQFYTSHLLDTTTFPYVRLPKFVVAKIDVAGLDGSKPCYAFTEEDSGGAEYTYIVSGRSIAKVKLSDNTLANAIRDADIDSVSRTPIIGRPVLFEGKWYVPCGGNLDWIQLDTVATGATADTWNTAATLSVGAGFRRAYHFALHMQEGTAQIAGAFNVSGDSTPDAGVECNQLSLSADALAWGTKFEVGDTSLAITHMESVGGELFIAKPDSPWRVSEDGGGNAYPVMDFVGKAQKLSGYTGEDGALSGSWGSFGYFTHSSGIWRIAGDHATPIDPQADPRWTGIALDSLIPSFLGRWGSVTTYGRWMYACAATEVFQGYLLEDGSVRWAGVMFDNGFSVRAMIAPDSSNPILWILDSNNDLHRIDLNEDGSTREISTPGTRRGAYGTAVNPTVATAQLWMPETDFGAPGVTKQLRMGWFDMDDFTDTGVTVSIRVHRDRAATATALGSGVASGVDQSTLHEVSMTPGTDDTFRRLIPALRFVTTGSYTPASSDPRCREWGVRAVTPHVYRITIPLDHPSLRGYGNGIKDALTDLRDLKSGASIAIKEPGFNATFTGYITDVQEQASVSNAGVVEYSLVLSVMRWVL